MAKKTDPVNNTHGNTKRTQEKRNEMMQLIRNDVSVKTVSEYCGISEETFYAWVRGNEKLSDDYARAKNFLNIMSSNVIATTITDKNIDKETRVKYALERKKRRDKRYMDKNKLFGDAENPLQVIVKKIGQKDEPTKEEQQKQEE